MWFGLLFDLLSMESFLELLLSLTERSGVIARLIRGDKDLFGSLVEEKSGTAKNQRFEVDFKTLSDTLIQELFKHFIGEKVRVDSINCM